MIKVLKGLTTNVVCVVGGVALVLGEIDDAPGLGGIGLILIAISMYLNYKVIKNK